MFNLSLEQRNDLYYKYLEQVELSFDEIRKRINKTLTNILGVIKEQTLAYCIEPLYNTAELDKLKKLLLEKKHSLSKTNHDDQAKHLADYLKVYTHITATLIDAGTSKDFRGPADLDTLAPPEVEQEDVAETIKALRKVLDEFAGKLAVQVATINSPEENMKRTQNIIPDGNNPNLNTSPLLPRKRTEKANSMLPTSRASINQGHKVDQGTPASIRNTYFSKFKSLVPADETMAAQLPPFIYDEYLETEVVDLPYVGPIKLQDGAIYKGQMRDGKRHGKGKQLWEDGKIYEGYFKNDVMHGKGRMVHTDQDIYEGQWVDGKAHGNGKYIKPDGWVYEGEWVEDEVNGKGIEFWPDGSIYEGDFENGVKSGKGTLIGPDGSCYSGGFKDNLFSGEGKYIWVDGRKYEGHWVNNLREGKGTMTWPDGRKYAGEFIQDKREGYGKYQWGDGRKYNGYWKDGKQHGRGKLQNTAGKVVEGEWVEGKMILATLTTAFQQTKSTFTIDPAKEKLELRVSRAGETKTRFNGDKDEGNSTSRESRLGTKEVIQNDIKSPKEDDKSHTDRDDGSQKMKYEKSDETNPKRDSMKSRESRQSLFKPQDRKSVV